MDSAGFHLTDLLAENGVKPRLLVVDVGAFPQEGAEPFYEPLVKLGVCTVIGFEPAPGVCEEHNRRRAPLVRLFPYAIGDGSVREFKLCNATTTSSLYEPDQELLEKFDLLAVFSKVIARQNIRTLRLDDIAETAGCDYLKLDVQGGELDVLRGAPKLLSGVCVMESEVEFIRYYKDQPLFGDIDRAARDAGLQFHKFKALSSYPFKPFKSGVSSQQIFSDAVFVRDFMKMDSQPAEKLVKTAIILHEIYQSYDLAALFLQGYDTQAGTSIAPSYISHFPHCLTRKKPVFLRGKALD